MSDVNDNATDDESIRDSISNAISEVEEAPETQVASVEQDNKPDLKSDSEKPARARDASGKFAKAAEEVVDDGLIGGGKPAEATPSEGVPPEVAEVIAAPQSWSQEAKDQFNALNAHPIIQKELLKREQDYNKGIQSKAESAKYGELVRPMFDKWMPYLQSRGATPDVAFEALMNAEHLLQTGSPDQKRQALIKLANDYNITFGETPQGQPQTQDPNMQQVYGRVQQLEQQIQNQQYAQVRESKRLQQEQDVQLNSMVTEFASNPKYPHFEVLREKMAQIVQSGMAETLEDAYDQASWNNPDVRSSLIQVGEAKRIAELANIAKTAKAKKVSITGAPSGTETPVKNRSIRDDLIQAMSGDEGRL